MKKKLLFILGFIIGFIICGGIYWFIHYDSKETPQSIEKTKQFISEKDIILEPIQYSSNHLITSLSISPESLQVVDNSQYFQHYTVTVKLFKNTSDNIYILFDPIEWDIHSTLDIDYSLDKTLIQDKNKLKDFESQLEKIAHNESHNLTYGIDITSVQDQTHEIHFVGTLK